MHSYLFSRPLSQNFVLTIIAVVVDATLYTFGGLDAKFNHRNALWTLNKTKTESFTWSFIKFQHDKESPSPRNGHTGWEYGGKLWVFGGEGPSPEHYLNDNGTAEFIALQYPYECNNQLLCYDPSTHKWTNPQCFGFFPSPRFDHVSAIIKDNVWVLGGNTPSFDSRNDTFELSMDCLTWTHIQTNHPHQMLRESCSLTALSDHQLVLYLGCEIDQQIWLPFSDTWIMDVRSHSWTQYTRKDHARRWHTGSTGLNNNVIIIGGVNDFNTYESYNSVFLVMLKAKSLQQLAMQTIYKHQDELNWNCLPKKLTTLLGLSTKQKD